MQVQSLPGWECRGCRTRCPYRSASLFLNLRRLRLWIVANGIALLVEAGGFVIWCDILRLLSRGGIRHCPLLRSFWGSPLGLL